MNLISGVPRLRAYHEAGFTGGDAQACRALQRPAVAARHAEMMEGAAVRAEITKADVLRELAKMGFANMADYMRVGPDGDPVLDFSAVSRDQAAALTEVTVEDYKDGRGEDAREVRKVKFKLADKRASLVDIAKIMGWLSERVEHSGPDGGPIEIADMDLARLIAFQLTKAAAEA